VPPPPHWSHLSDRHERKIVSFPGDDENYARIISKPPDSAAQPALAEANLVVIVGRYDLDQALCIDLNTHLEDEWTAHKVDDASGMSVPGMDGVRQDRRSLGEADLDLFRSFWSDLNPLRGTIEKIPSLAAGTGSQNPFGHLGVRLMKIEITPACSTHQGSAFSGIGIRYERAKVAMTLHRVSHGCVLQ
jgi:hypothetical protein